MANPEVQILYTIEVRILSGSVVERRISSQISDNALGSMWDELGVTAARWKSYNESLYGPSVPDPLLPEFPELSILAAVDEGSLKFCDSRLQELRADCERTATRVRSDTALSLIQQILRACDDALALGGTVVIHPFSVDDLLQNGNQSRNQ